MMFAWYGAKCKLLEFQPYYYRASNAGNPWRPNWNGNTDTDCTAGPTPADCWGGAGRFIIPDFPKNSAIIYLPDEADSTSARTKVIDIPSAYEKSYRTNRMMANDYATPAVAIPQATFGTGDQYEAGTMVNWTLTCRDDWFDPATYQINLTVTDEDTDGTPNSPPLDHIETWKEY
jgi:hypothetical protein